MNALHTLMKSIAIKMKILSIESEKFQSKRQETKAVKRMMADIIMSILS